MEAATKGVLSENMIIRGFKVSFDTLRRHFNGSVIPGSKPGPVSFD